MLTPTGSLMPLLVTKHFGGDALQFGIMDSFWGGGVVLGGLILSVWGGFRRKILTALMGVLGIAIGTLMVGLAPATMFWLALAGVALGGFMSSMTNAPIMAVIQSVVRPDMQGRVMALITSAVMAATPLSLMVAGPVSDRFGIQTWFLAAGLLTLVVGVADFFNPALLHIEDHREA